MIRKVLDSGTRPKLAWLSESLAFKFVIVSSVLKLCTNALAHDNAPVVRVESHIALVK